MDHNRCSSHDSHGAAFNNTMYAILSGMNGLQYYALLATLSSLGMAIMCVIGGRIGDMIGRRAVILAGAVLSLASAIVMGLAQSLSVFIVARAVLSFGIGTFPGNAFVVAADVSDAKQYPKVAALLTATLMVATFLGSTIAGYLVDAGLIPAAIIYPGVVGLIGAVIAAAKMDKKPTTDGVRGKVDGIGMVLLAVFMLSLCLSLNQGANLGFGNPIIICGFVVAVVSLLALLKVEKKAEVPVIPLYLFKNKKYTGVIIAGAFITFYEVVMASYVPVSGQALMGLSASITGYFSLPRTIIAIALAAPAAAWVVKNQAKNSAIGLAAAGLLAAVAFLGMIFVGAGSPVALPFILIGITGFTEALKGASFRPLVISQLEPKDFGVGIGMMTATGTLLMTILLSIVGPVFTAVSAQNMGSALRFVYIVTVCCALIAVAITVFATKDSKSKN